jgi:hypothetical protein
MPPFLEPVLFLVIFILRNLSYTMATGILRVKGDQVVDGNGQTIILRGAGLGGWLKYQIPDSLYITRA